MQQPQYKALRPAYGFDEVALVPGDVTINPEQVETAISIGSVDLSIPVIASAMDAVTDPSFAINLGKLGGLAVLHLEGVQVRYEDPSPVLKSIAEASQEEVTGLLQKVYKEPVKAKLIGERISTIKAAGATCAVSIAPANAKRVAPLAAEAGADMVVIQATVITARHISKSQRGLIFSEFCDSLPIPVLVGNCVSFGAAMELMNTGIAGLFVGVGPGAACTTREVLGVGIPQVTATMNCSAARDQYFKESGRYVSIITDGGLRTGGDVCKSIAAGADAVMMGSPFAGTEEAPGGGSHWGMAMPDPALPRGTRIQVGTKTTLERLLFGPTSRTDGTENLVGALRSAMGICGAMTIKDMHNVEMVIAPSIKTEGKLFQMMQGR